MVQENDVRRVNTRNAAGLDGVTGRVLKKCADQLSKVFIKVSNLSLSKSIIPPCLKSTTVIPLPKKTSVTTVWSHPHWPLWNADNNLILKSLKSKSTHNRLPIVQTLIHYTSTGIVWKGSLFSGSWVHIFLICYTHIAEDLSWIINTIAIVNKTQQWLYFLRFLRKYNPQEKLSYYCCSIESVMMNSICAWYDSSSAPDRRADKGDKYHPEDHQLLTALFGGLIQTLLFQ